MRTPPFTIAVVLVLTALFAAGGSGHAQADLVSTYLETTPSPPADGWDGGSTSGSVLVELCSDEEGGFNPLGGSVVVQATASGPGWLDAEVSPETIELSPSTGPEADPPGCMDSGTFTVTVRTDDVNYGVSVTIDVSLSIAESEGDGDVPVPTDAMGTYAAPSGANTGFTFATADPPAAANGDGAGNGGGGGGPNGTPDANDSPAPAAVVAVGLVALAVAYARRRR